MKGFSKNIELSNMLHCHLFGIKTPDTTGIFFEKNFLMQIYPEAMTEHKHTTTTAAAGTGVHLITTDFYPGTSDTLKGSPAQNRPDSFQEGR